MAGTTKERLLVIGLDCAEPTLVFDAWRTELPHFCALMEEGTWGPLESCHPPLPVPAWASLLSGRDPGELGVYGSRTRPDRGYAEAPVASGDIPAERLWQTFSSEGLRCAVLGVPATFPHSEVNGVLVSCPEPPEDRSASTHPPELLEELERACGGPLCDPPQAPDQDEERLLEEIRAATSRRFGAARHLLGLERWDLLVMVETGTRRIHQRFMRHFDREHRLYRPGNRFQSALHDHYVELDAEIGRTVDAAGDVSVLVISPYGAQPLRGGVRVNEWLRREGYLRLLEPVAPPGELRAEQVDWQATSAWADGESCGRLYLNLEGREPQGYLPPERGEPLREEIAARLAVLEGPYGRALGAAVHRPAEVYRALSGVPPDLLVYFAGLSWPCLGSFQGGEVLAGGEDLPFDAGPSPRGLLIYRGPDVPWAGRGREQAGLSVYDLAPTFLRKFHLPAPADLRGRSLF